MGNSLKDLSLMAPIIETKTRLKNKNNIIKLDKYGEKKRKLKIEKLNIANIEGRA